MGDRASPAKLGAFLGVFTPTILTILGVIMYLRFGWVLGHMGLERTLIIVALANVITVITTLSFSSVATNTHVGVGGAYYIISRSLGIEIGGAVGLPLFLSQAFSVTLYAFGLAEALSIVWPGVPVQTVAFVIIGLVGLLALAGASMALKTQLPVMVLVGVSLLALVVGALLRWDGTTVPAGEPSGDVAFWVAFAVFFPAVTGVMAGLGLSGDLKDPGRAIPRGALWAVVVGFAIYMVVPLLLAIGADTTTLREDSMVWSRISPLGAWVIMPGLLGAIFSSAVGSILAAPRTLQALARDRLAPRLLGRHTGDWKELAPGIALSTLLALAAGLLGDLNTVAPVVSMFFLTVYGTVNVVAAFEGLSGDPSWRPKLRVPWPISLLGGLACIGVMFLINIPAAIVAIVLEIGIWLYLSRKEHETRWGDARRGLYESLIRWALVQLARRPVSPRNWRPHVMVFANEPEEQLDLIRFGNWFSQDRGVVTVCELVVGDLRMDLDLRARRLETQAMLDRERLVVFAEVDVVHDVVDGITSVAQANGMAGMQSNTVLLGWPNGRERQTDFLRTMKKLERLNKSLILGRVRPRYLFPREGVERSIDVWWGGLQNNSHLMLLLAFLLTRNPEWRDAKVRVMSIAADDDERQRIHAELEALVQRIRIRATPHVVTRTAGTEVMDVIHRESARSDVVFLGLGVPADGDEASYAERLENLAGELSTVFFVKNSSLFSGALLTGAEEPVSQSSSE